MRITAKMLTEKEACANQVRRFKKLFPRGVKVTRAVCLKHARDFDWDWAAYNLLSVPAWEAYKKARAPALEAYKKATAPAWKAYKKAKATALDAYEKARATAREAYKKVSATAFADAALAETERKAGGEG